MSFFIPYLFIYLGVSTAKAITAILHIIILLPYYFITYQNTSIRTHFIAKYLHIKILFIENQ